MYSDRAKMTINDSDNTVGIKMYGLRMLHIYRDSTIYIIYYVLTGHTYPNTLDGKTSF